MNRVLVVAAVLGLSVMGCATDVDDPVVNPTDEPQRDPPSQTLSGDLRTPGSPISVDVNAGDFGDVPQDLGPRQPYPIPR